MRERNMLCHKHYKKEDWIEVNTDVVKRTTAQNERKLKKQSNITRESMTSETKVKKLFETNNTVM